MDTSPAVEAARQFLTVSWEGETPSDETLLAALDRLVMAFHETPETGPSDSELEAPFSDGEALYHEVAARFPDYGYYPISDPLASIESASMMADAVDDLADLTKEMREVVWLAEHVSVTDANWHYRLLYFHWGQHARRLALYLHARRDA